MPALWDRETCLPLSGSHLRAILFDLYDTLVWLDAAASDARRRELARRAGVTFERFTTAWRRGVNDRMLGRGSGLLEHLAETLESLGIAPEAGLLAELADAERRRLVECVHPYPGAERVLLNLSRRGYRLGLVSNVSDGAAVPIDHLGIGRLFDEVVLSHEVGLLKPDPAIFLLACERLDVSPREAAFVADGGFGELDASRSLGILSVLIEQDHQSRDYGASKEYDLKVHSLEELLTLFPPFHIPDPPCPGVP